MQNLKKLTRSFISKRCQRSDYKNKDENLDKEYTPQISPYQVIINSSVINTIFFYVRKPQLFFFPVIN